MDITLRIDDDQSGRDVARAHILGDEGPKFDVGARGAAGGVVASTTQEYQAGAQQRQAQSSTQSCDSKSIAGNGFDARIRIIANDEGLIGRGCLSRAAVRRSPLALAFLPFSSRPATLTGFDGFRSAGWGILKRQWQEI